MKTSIIAALGTIAATLIVPQAQAASLFVQNASFETLPAGGLAETLCGIGCSYSIHDPIPGWVSSPAIGSTNLGAFQPGVSSGNTAFFNSVPDGRTVAYSNLGSLSQTVGDTAIAGKTYQLLVDVGFRKDFPNDGTVSLIVGGHSVVATGIANQLSGNWSTYTANYLATAADAERPIQILLETGGAQANWDNVRLSTLTAGVPEPASWAFMLSGFGLTGAAMRRRARTVSITFA